MRVGTCGKSKRPAGSIVVIVLVALLVATMLGASLIQAVLIHHRQVRILAGQQQASWLADAGVLRAVRHLSDSRDYTGETWQVPAEVLGPSRTAEVTIRVAQLDGRPDGREIQVQVALKDGTGPAGGFHRQQRVQIPAEEKDAESDP
ncbi:MAG: hypothetical protein ACYC6Y_00850 [Thermoguttaceae bacterium]